jgi:hypothetical protein
MTPIHVDMKPAADSEDQVEGVSEALEAIVGDKKGHYRDEVVERAKEIYDQYWS